MQSDDNGGNELKPRATVLEDGAEGDDPVPRDLDSAMDELLADPSPTRAPDAVIVGRRDDLGASVETAAPPAGPVGVLASASRASSPSHTVFAVVP